MGLLTRESGPRKRVKRIDVEAAMRGDDASRLRVAFSRERLLDTLTALLFFALDVFIITVGAKGADVYTTLGIAGVLGGAYVAFALFIAEHDKELLEDRRRLAVIQAGTAACFALAKLFIVLRWPILLLPLGFFSIGFSVALGQAFAIVWTLVVATVIGFMGAEPGSPLSIAATLGLGTAVGVLVLGERVSRRAKVIRAGLISGIAYAALVFASEVLLKGQPAVSSLVDAPGRLWPLLAMGALNGVATAYLLTEFGLRFVENVFDVVTDLRLQELADLNQPFLKRFAMEAPGTYHHSQMVGTLAEAAAEAVGGNPLLCRVGAHFHDMGKMAKPEYYIENVTQGVGTKHEGLTPRMSTLIIVSHVKDGVEMAEELGLPSCVIDFIPEHHGTIAVEYFYHQAVKQWEKEGGPPVSKDDFRYPGPMPQSKETAILMIADSVEAISRVLQEPNPSRIEQMVHDVVQRRLNEGQFDECGITLAELKRVEEAMVRVLNGIFHGRIKYPKGATVDRQSQASISEEVVIKTPPPGPLPLPHPTPQPQFNPDDTQQRIRFAGLAADGPGTPSRHAIPAPGSGARQDGKAGDPELGEAPTPISELRRPKSGARY